MAKAKRRRGRPSVYRAEYASQANKLCLLGATDRELADFFEVSEATVNTWKQRHPAFLDSIKEGRKAADAKVARSLFERACGYSHPEDKIFQYEGAPVIVPTTKHYPPDTMAASLWLRNRRPDLWRDKQEIAGSVEVSGTVEHRHEHTIAADADSLAEVLAILAPLVGNGHDQDAAEPTLQ
jgi:hypothetical protein